MRMFLMLALLSAGLATSGFLFDLSLDIRAGAGGGGLCSALFGDGCARAVAGDLALPLGLPLSGWGVLLYAMMTADVIAGRFRTGDARRTGTSFVLLAATLAAFVGLGLTATMLAGFAPLCPFCLAFHAVSLMLLCTVRCSAGTRYADSVRRGMALFRILFVERDRIPVESRERVTHLLLVCCVGLLGYFALSNGYLRATLRGEHTDPAAVLAALDRLPHREIPVDSSDAALGAETAGLQMIVFSDFSCPSCRDLALELRAIQTVFGKDVRLVFKHFPLGKNCNPLLQEDIHPGSCLAARAAEAARLQRRFWSFHDSLFLRREEVTTGWLTRVAKTVGLDTARFARDLDAEDVAGAVGEDIALGNRLGITGTPAVFVNGRLLQDTRPRAVHDLIEYAELKLREFRHRMRGPAPDGEQ